MDSLETSDMSSKEIDGIVKSLRTSFQVHHVGNVAFFATANHVERLALAIHNPEVIKSLRMYDRLQVLVEMLLAIEAWRTFVLPTGLIAMLEENSNCLRVTFILHTESTLVTLINAILYEACSRLSEEVTIALIDYCARSMQILGEPVHRNRVVQHQRCIGPAVSVIQNALLNAEFKCCILAATSLLRNFCESFDELSLAAQTRLLETRDVLMLLVPLIEEPPWTRKLKDMREQRTWEKFIDNQWTEVKREELLKLTPCEGQCWISLFYLTCNVGCQARYRLTSCRKETLLKLATILKQDTIISQLPILENVKQYLSKLEEIQVPPNTNPETPMLEQIDTIRGNVMHTEDWDEIAKDQFKEIFSKLTDAMDNDVHKLGLLHASVGLDLSVPAPEVNQRFQGMKCVVPKRDEVIEVRFVNQSSTSQINLWFRDDATTTMETDHGTFQRRKLTVQKKGENVLPIDPLSIVTVSIAVMEGPAVFLQNVDNLDLKADREWRQVGSLETGLVLQLGFKRFETDGIGHCSFRLDKAFLAQR